MKRTALAAPTLEAKLEIQKQVRALESTRQHKRRSLFDAEDAIDQRHDALIQQIEGKLSATARFEGLFTIRFEVV